MCRYTNFLFRNTNYSYNTYLYYSVKDSVLLILQLWSTFTSTILIFFILLVTTAVFPSYVPTYIPHTLLLPWAHPTISLLHFPTRDRNGSINILVWRRELNGFHPIISTGWWSSVHGFSPPSTIPAHSAGP